MKFIKINDLDNVMQKYKQKKAEKITEIAESKIMSQGIRQGNTNKAESFEYIMLNSEKEEGKLFAEELFL